jgi:CRP/FNR family transcriptional regulator
MLIIARKYTGRSRNIEAHFVTNLRVIPLEVLVESVPLLPATRDASPGPACLPKDRCSHCHLRAWCLPNSNENSAVDCIDGLTLGRRRIRAGQRLYLEGEAFKFLYEVRSGNLKSSLKTADGIQRVSGFHMAGELIGLDGVAEGHHASSVTALEDSEVCAVSYAFLTELAARNVQIQRTLMQQMSGEIVRELRLLVLLGSMTADERLAVFLLNQSQRLQARGYSSSDFRMRMTRADIGSYLGLTLETVSRTFSAFQKLGLLEVNQRHIRITNLDGLERIADMRAHG